MKSFFIFVRATLGIYRLLKHVIENGKKVLTVSEIIYAASVHVYAEGITLEE